MDGLTKLFNGLEKRWTYSFLLVVALIVVIEVVLCNIGMKNEALWLGIHFTWFFVIIAMYKMFGRWGLLTVFILNAVALNVSVLQITDIWGFTTGGAGDAFAFLITDILVEKYGRREALKCVGLGIAAMIIFMGTMWMTSCLQAGEFAFCHDEFSFIFGIAPRIAGASLLAFIIAQTNDVLVFSKLKNVTKGRFLWLRNNVSTLLSQMIDLIIFNAVAWWGLIPLAGIVEMGIVGYTQEVALLVADTFFIYLAIVIKPLGLLGTREEENSIGIKVRKRK